MEHKPLVILRMTLLAFALAATTCSSSTENDSADGPSQTETTTDAAADDPASEMGPGPRSKIKAAADYLAVAPEVVAVATRIELGVPESLLPNTPRDPDRLADLAQRWRLESPVERLLAVLHG